MFLIEYDKLKEKDIYQQLEEQINICRILEEQEIKQDSDPYDIEDELNFCRTIYNRYNSKLEEAKSLKTKDKEIERDFLTNSFKIDNLDYLNNKQKLGMILGYATLLTEAKSLLKYKADEELFMLSATVAKIDIEDYLFYILILSDKKVSKAILSKTDNLFDQVDISYAIMDSQDEYSYDHVNANNYDELVKNALKEIKNYNIKTQQKKS